MIPSINGGGGQLCVVMNFMDQYSNTRRPCSPTGPALAGRQRRSGIIRPDVRNREEIILNGR
jgi:hypothetical protein